MSPPIHRLSIPNPFFDIRNSIYLIKSDPVTLIDTGVATDRAFAQLESGLREFGIVIGDIRRVILTHEHIDHMGNAWRIQRESGAEILMHECDRHSVMDADPSSQRFVALVKSRMRDWLVPESELPSDEEIKMPPWRLESAEVHAVTDGQEIPLADGQIRVIHTPGHTIGSICLQYGERLFSGDHVLREMSPNVGIGDMQRGGMLGRFLSSLARISQLGDVEVLPGHGEPFRGLPQRSEQLRQHHEDRLEASRLAVRDGAKTVHDVATSLFGALRDFHVVLGCAEANAHLELLIERGEVRIDDGCLQLCS